MQKNMEGVVTLQKAHNSLVVSGFSNNAHRYGRTGYTEKQLVNLIKAAPSWTRLQKDTGISYWSLLRAAMENPDWISLPMFLSKFIHGSEAREEITAAFKENLEFLKTHQHPYRPQRRKKNDRTAEALKRYEELMAFYAAEAPRKQRAPAQAPATPVASVSDQTPMSSGWDPTPEEFVVELFSYVATLKNQLTEEQNKVVGLKEELKELSQRVQEFEQQEQHEEEEVVEPAHNGNRGWLNDVMARVKR